VIISAAQSANDPKNPSSVSTSFSKYGAYYKQAVLAPYSSVKTGKQILSIA